MAEAQSVGYNEAALVKLSGLKFLAEKVKNNYALKNELGGYANVIESIKVNGTAQTITNKAVNITVPTKTSALTNDAGYQTSAQVLSAIKTAIAESGHASFEVASSVPEASAAKSNVMYLVKNSSSGYYDIYAKVGTEVVRLDDTTVDLSGYVQKVSGKGLSTNDYTTPEKTKLAGIAAGANNYTHPSHTAKTSGLYKITVDGLGHVSAATAVAKSDITALGIPAQDTTYTHPTTAGNKHIPSGGSSGQILRWSADGTAVWGADNNTTYGVATSSSNGLMSSADKTKLDGMTIATDAEVSAMITSVFG